MSANILEGFVKKHYFAKDNGIAPRTHRSAQVVDSPGDE
jgi:hypothetical protein